MNIHILSDQMASRIAAGEVVERPASVVKELIENSLDAAATEISIWIERSGTALLRVTDNGEGMAADDLALAVERHATSKLKDEEDLFRIATLGFRGEALPSIGSIAKMEITSCPRSAEAGSRLRIEGGKKEEIRQAAPAPGTTVEIRDIFFNTPARRKFLKAPATELSHICQVFNRMALAYPAVHFFLSHDGRTVADYPPASDPKDRLFQVFGRDIAKSLIPLAWKQSALAIRGFLSAAPATFPNARYLMTFVNGRFVRDKIITHALLSGYETLLMKGQYPAVVLFLEVPYDEVDVNVHPAKYEVRFRRQSEIYSGVAGAVRAALKIEARAPMSKSGSAGPPRFVGVMDASLPYTKPPLAGEHGPAAVAERFPVPVQFVSEGDGFFSSMQVLGQILGCYLVCSSARGLAVIDQHAAHERVMFERLRAQTQAGGIAKQELLIPQTVEFSAGEAMFLEEKRPLLEGLGFTLEPFGGNAYAITAVPGLLPEGDYRQVIRQIVAELAEVDQSDRVKQQLEERLATIACHSVIRAHRKLAADEIRALLRELDQVDFATQCPHGRPVLLEFSGEELEKLFKRV